MTIWRENCASIFEANKAVSDVGELRLSPWPPKNYTALRRSQQKLRHSYQTPQILKIIFKKSKSHAT
jgi:hypothetical protein